MKTLEALSKMFYQAFLIAKCYFEIHDYNAKEECINCFKERCNDE